MAASALGSLFGAAGSALGPKPDASTTVQTTEVVVTPPSFNLGALVNPVNYPQENGGVPITNLIPKLSDLASAPNGGRVLKPHKPSEAVVSSGSTNQWVVIAGIGLVIFLIGRNL